jgi:hypothetical protein
VSVLKGELVAAQPHDGCRYHGRAAETSPNWAEAWFAYDRPTVGLGEAALLTVSEAARRLAGGEDWTAVQEALACRETRRRSASAAGCSGWLRDRLARCGRDPLSKRGL